MSRPVNRPDDAACRRADQDLHLERAHDARFNRRRSASRGLVFYRLLELAVGHDPVRYRDLIVRQRSKAPPAPPGTRGHPPSLERSGANRPWRAAEMQLQLPYSG